MQYESVKQALEVLNETEATINAYNHAMNVLGIDAATVAPEASAAHRGKTMGVLGGVVYGLIADAKNIELAKYLLEKETITGTEFMAILNRVEALPDVEEIEAEVTGEAQDLMNEQE